MAKWRVVYRRAIEADGTLIFPGKQPLEFLENARRTQGSYIFANQYQNEIIPSDELVFKPHWLRYFEVIPENVHTFIYIDPAISLEDGADYTAIVVVHVDDNGFWYVPYAHRFRLSPTEIVDTCFKLQKAFNPLCIGIEEVAYQKALLYMLDEEMKRRQTILPVKGIHPGTQQSKESRILGLVPRFEWGRIYLAQGLTHLEDELAQFPRGSHDDILDCLSSIALISVAPTKRERKDEKPNPADATNYESWYRRELAKGRDFSQEKDSGDSEEF